MSEKKTAETIANELLCSAAAPDRKSIRDACNDDSGLEQQVLAILHEVEAGGHILERFQSVIGVPQQPTAAHLEIGIQFDQFVLTENIARGGFGNVWTARMPNDRLCVIKFLHSCDDAIVRENEKRIMQQVGQIDGVADFIDSGMLDGHPYIAMEYIEGQCLADVEQPAHPSVVCDWIVTLARTISRLHDFPSPKSNLSGFAHGDITPRNIIIHPHQGPVLIDFGAAFGIEDAHLSNDDDAPLIALRPSGHSLDYRVPEVSYGVAPSSTADIYQLASVAFELYCGQRYCDVCEQGAEADAWSELERKAGVRVGRVLRRALSWKPSERYQNGQEFLQALEQAIIVSPRNRSVILFSLPCALALFGAAFWFTTRPKTPALSQSRDGQIRPGLVSNLLSTENDDVGLEAGDATPTETARTQARETEASFRTVVMPTIHRYLDFDQLHDQEAIDFYNRKELELEQAIRCCKNWLHDSQGASQSRHVKRWVEWLESANKPFAVIVQLGFVSEGNGVYDLHVTAGVTTREFRLKSQEGPNECILMNIKSHMPINVCIRDSNGKPHFEKSLVGLMAFHKGRIPNDMSFHVLHDGWDIYGRVILHDPPIAPVGRPRLQRRRKQ